MACTVHRNRTERQPIQEMRNTYGSVDELEELFNETDDMKMYVDLGNWKHYRNHLDDEIEITQTIISQNH